MNERLIGTALRQRRNHHVVVPFIVCVAVGAAILLLSSVAAVARAESKPVSSELAAQEKVQELRERIPFRPQHPRRKESDRRSESKPGDADGD